MEELLEQIKQKEIEKYNAQIADLEKQLEDVKNEQIELPQDNSTFIYRVIHPFKYKKDKELLSQKISEYTSKIHFNSKEEIRLKSEIRSIEDKKRNPLQYINVEGEKNVYNYCIQNNIEIKFSSIDESFKNMPNYFGSNLEFMKEAVKEDPLYCCFDKTDDLNLFKIVLESFIEQYTDSNHLYEYKELLEKLSKEDLEEDDKKILIYFFESLKYVSLDKYSRQIEDVYNTYNRKRADRRSTLF